MNTGRAGGDRPLFFVTIARAGFPEWFPKVGAESKGVSALPDERILNW